MRQRRSKTGALYLAAVAGLSILVLVAVEHFDSGGRGDLYGKKLLAAGLMNRGMELIREAKLEKGLTADRDDDPNLTGLIGTRFTEITTTLGPLPAKRTTTNPDFAAVLVGMLAEAGVGEGDVVAAGFSGSFPGLNLASSVAVKALGARLLAISSVAASTWGATDPMMTWLDMERVLFGGGVLPGRSMASSLGGYRDRGEFALPGGREIALRAVQRNGLPLILEDTLAESVQKRLDAYLTGAGGREIKVFINVGGAEANLGDCPHSWQAAPGLVRNLPPCSHTHKGVAFYLAEKGIPVINLLNVRSIAAGYGLPIDPIPLPGAGEGAVYSRKKSPFLPVTGLVFLCSVLILAAGRVKSGDQVNADPGIGAGPPIDRSG